MFGTGKVACCYHSGRAQPGASCVLAEIQDGGPTCTGSPAEGPSALLLQKFNKWLDDKLDSSIVPALLVYPEGEELID